MALRLIELLLPTEEMDKVDELLEDRPEVSYWSNRIDEKTSLVRIVLPVEESEEVLDTFEKEYGSLDDFRAIVLNIETVVPRKDEAAEKEKKVDGEKKDRWKVWSKIERVSREELYTDVVENAKATPSYIVIMFLSVVVTTIGVLQDNVAVIIGGSIISPLLGPNLALSLAVTLGDTKLARRTARAFFLWIGIALLFSILVGALSNVNPFVEEIFNRVTVNIDDLALGFASGLAAALFVSMGASTSLIGVVQAVALLPPLVTLGILVGSGNIDLAYGSGILFLMNIIAINLAGIIMFVSLGIRPLNWWEQDEAKRGRNIAIVTWLVLLVSLLFLIYLSQGW